MGMMAQADVARGAQPWRLERRIDDVNDRLRALALKNYHVFVQNQQCAQVVTTELQSLSENVTMVQSSLPELVAQSKTMDTTAQEAAKNNAEIQYVLSQYASIMNLLEIPHLIDGCIANDLAEDALETIQFAKKLLEQTYVTSAQQHTTCHGPSTIVRTLVAEVKRSTLSLRAKLVEKLRGELPLAKCLHLVAYLRRVDGLWSPLPIDYDDQLKQEFLECRDAWLSKTIQTIPTSDSYNYLMQVVDAKRSSWFDLITQFSAIFGHQEVHGRADAALSAWALRTVSDLMRLLETVLPNIVELSAIANIMEQVLFFGGSLGRVGVDFRGIVLVIFQAHLMTRLTAQWTDAVADFESALGLANSAHGSRTQTITTPLMIHSFRNLPQPPPGDQHDSSVAPQSIMAFPALAQLTNGFLTSFNDLRLCALMSIRYRLSLHLQHVMTRVVEALCKFCHQHAVAPTEASMDTAAVGKLPMEFQVLKLAQVLDE
ncbi:hypothetical protein, variant 2 [Aphanomyces invadans]|uniref:Conserved oligomeric Golgi complex subunit 8 n=1 Tax=Aphanomyces invadans TaxID=157072 RepID=A0A024UU38_9STRA|nr:hypothetical protein, variant 2 [Aphanomyces invadans]ETW09450.1 hypothetical protein, variant 2 [Aphanomyces invadans]|eukprot:XP_008860865.1 hypothetical protein, variant 2 [Aphanomyces invadans]